VRPRTASFGSSRCCAALRASAVPVRMHAPRLLALLALCFAADLAAAMIDDDAGGRRLQRGNRGTVEVRGPSGRHRACARTYWGIATRRARVGGGARTKSRPCQVLPFVLGIIFVLGGIVGYFWCARSVPAPCQGRLPGSAGSWPLSCRGHGVLWRGRGRVSLFRWAAAITATTVLHYK
jgi:hypothetical protein